MTTGRESDAQHPREAAGVSPGSGSRFVGISPQRRTRCWILPPSCWAVWKSAGSG